MKKFTKVCLIIVAAMAGLGVIFCGIAAIMGFNYGMVRQMARNGELSIGGWHYDDKNGFNFYYGDDDDWIDSDWNENHESGETIAGIVGTEQSDGSYGTSGTFQTQEVKKLKLDIDAAEIYFEEASDTDAIHVELNRGYEKYYECFLDGDTLKVKYDTRNHYLRINRGPKITISIPKGMYFEKMDLGIGAASVEFDLSDVICDNLIVDVGAGDMTANSFEVKEKMEITIGAGSVEINGGTYQNVKLDCGMGDVSMEGKVNGDLFAHCGMGEIDLELKGNETDYNYDLSCGMGELEVNGTSYSNLSGSRKVTNQGAIGEINLDCGMGSIDVEIR